ncbi:MAG: hypothetical protein IKH88_06605 [Prevotella sp.]|nr:hypothetical protein [Prevotella sp.]
MTEIHSFKPLEQAILEGEKELKVTTPKFLIACAVAEKCQADPDAIKRLIGFVMEERNGIRHSNPETTYTLLSDKGRPFMVRLTLSTIADALHIIKILNQLYASIKVQEDENGHLTGMIDILN